MRAMLSDEHVGFVQARCDYLNAGENRITWAQQRILDAHFAVEQAARNWSGHLMPFNGTCGFVNCDGSVRQVNYNMTGSTALGYAMDYNNKVPFDLEP